jgi:hypothetical protein
MHFTQFVKLLKERLSFKCKKKGNDSVVSTEFS